MTWKEAWRAAEDDKQNRHKAGNKKQNLSLVHAVFLGLLAGLQPYCMTRLCREAWTLDWPCHAH